MKGFNVKYRSTINIVLPVQDAKKESDFLKKDEIFFIREESPEGKIFPIKYKLLNKDGFFWKEVDKNFVNFIRSNNKLFIEIK